MNFRKNSKGITLIALVITIIVLLILAGVSLDFIAGENGILEKAREAVAATEKAREKEMLELSKLEVYMVESLDPWNGKIADSFESGDGSEKDPYIIENAEQLAYLASQVKSGETFENKFIEITESINLGNVEFSPIELGSINQREETEWNMAETGFNGVLDGNGKIITGIKITQEKVHGVGIIGVLGEKGIVKNLNICNGTIIGKTCVGGIVGASKGTIINCTNRATIIAQDDETTNSGQMAGGIVGYVVKGKVENCINYGNVTTKDDLIEVGRGKYAGGIVGFAALEEDFTISNCTNYGEIVAIYQQAGGIIGSTQYAQNSILTIKNCTNLGKIASGDSEGKIANGYTGGIIGWAYDETNLIDCNNSGEVTSAHQIAGGIIGDLTKGTVTNCKNSGNITVKNSGAAGIVAQQQAGTIIKGCSNSGNISGSTICGGIVAVKGNSIIENSINSGEVFASVQMAGGIVGGQLDGTIKECKNNGKISTESGSGGIVGLCQNGMIENSFNNGEIVVNNSVGGGIAGQQQVGTITGCENAGLINGTQMIGGIVGGQVSGTINGCENSGDISAKNASGGIVGLQKNGTIQSTLNTGKILATNNAAGGIVGQQEAGSIDDSKNSGPIIANDQMAGGIIGRQNGGNLTNCENSGNIISKSINTLGITGGIVGAQAKGTIENVYNSGNVETVKNPEASIDYTGGIVGWGIQGNVKTAYNKGILTGETAVGGIVGRTTSTLSISETYYYTTQEINGVGTDLDILKEVEDVEGEVQKTEKDIASLSDFLNEEF